MKKLILAITTLIGIAANSQVKTTDATAPNFNDGTIKVDTTGTGIKTWAVYKVANGFRQDPEIAKDFSTASNLTLGTYWVLGKRKSDGLSKFSLDTLINITIAVAKNCDSLKVSYFNAIQMPDPQNPQMQSTCISYSVSKATNPSIDKIYLQEWNGMISQYFGPSQGGCYPNMAQNAKIHAVITDVNGCSVVGTNATDYKPTNYPVMTVPGTEPGPITNHVTIGVADCSGYYIHYNDVQYKICNSGAARGMVHLDSIVVAGLNEGHSAEASQQELLGRLQARLTILLDQRRKAADTADRHKLLVPVRLNQMCLEQHRTEGHNHYVDRNPEVRYQIQPEPVHRQIRRKHPARIARHNHDNRRQDLDDVRLQRKKPKHGGA